MAWSCDSILLNNKLIIYIYYKAITVAPESRRQGFARYLMDYLEKITINIHDGYFVDLFVRSTNKVAVDMYKNFGNLKKIQNNS